MSRVIGLDLSLTSTGIAVVVDGQLATVGNVKTKGSRKDTLEQRGVRLNRISSGIMHEVGEYTYHYTDLAVVEAPSFGSSGGSAHDRSGLWWKVVHHFLAMNIPVATVAPKTRQKYIIGSGGNFPAVKKIVLAHAIERYVVEGGPRITNDDMADAVGLAAMGARRLGEPVEADLPETNLEAMDGVLWPI